jgi:hypothetical protein
MRRSPILATLLCLIASACSPVDERVSSAIGNAVRDQKVQQLRLADLTTFKWDRVFLFEPYTPRTKVCQAIGVQPLRCQQVVAFESTDDGTMTLAFMSGGQLVRYARHSRWNGDFVPLSASQPIPASKAIFRVVPAGTAQNGTQWLRLSLNEA